MMADKIGLIVCGKEHLKIPLDSISIQTNIYGLLAHFMATFAYTNSTKDPIEVEFRHPLHSDSVLVGIEASIDGKIIRGVVKEKEEAKAVYEDAIASGSSAVLVTEEMRDIVGIVLGNLSPGKKAEVRLQLLQQLEVEEQGIHLLLPVTLKPRYELNTEQSTRHNQPINPTHSGASPPPVVSPNILTAIYKFGFELFIMSEIGKVKQITSPSHPLEAFVATDGRKGMHLTCPDPLNSDLVVYVDIEAIRPLSALVEPALPVREARPDQHPFIDNPAVLLTFLPKSSQSAGPGGGVGASIRGEFVFVIDQSGSMGGDAIRNARETLDMLVRSLSPGSYFNIIGFGSSFHSLFPEGSVAFEQSSLDRGIQHVKGLGASLGGTKILQPLESIYAQKPVPGLSRQLFLLTDGGVSNTAAVVRIVADNVHNTRVFTFGIGSGVSTDLVTSVARAGGGKAVFISGKERMQSRVMEVMNIAVSPSYTGISVTGSKKMSVYPESIPVVFENEPLVVVAFLREKLVEGEKMSATLQYSSECERKQCSVELSLSDSVSALSPQLPSQLVHQFGVSKALRDLEGGVSSKEECVALSCYANVMCKHTAFVAVSEDMEGRVVKSSMKVYNLKMAPIPQPPIPQAPIPQAPVYSYPSYNTCLSNNSGRSPSSRYCREKRSSAVDLVNFEPSFTAEREYEVSSIDFVAENYFSNFTYAGNVGFLDCGSSVSTPSYMGHQSIMALQKAEGHWEYSEELARLLGCKDVKQSCPSEIKDLQTWVTLLCIAFLHVRFDGYKSEWLLVSKKGERWVQSNLDTVGGQPSYHHLLELATKFVQK